MSVCSVTVVGAGGTGASLLKLLGATQGISQYFLDTSDSKWGVLPQYVEKLLIGTANAEGAGKDRGKHAGIVDAHLQSMFAASAGDMSGNGIPGSNVDVVILMYSASGGSGSVIGPMYAQYLRSIGKCTIECVAMSMHSAVNIANNVGTLKTLSNYAASGQVVPVVLVPSANKSADFAEADQELVAQVKLMIDQLTTEVIGLDTNDRLKGIRPNQPGMYMCISVDDADEPIPPGVTRDPDQAINLKHRRHTIFPSLNTATSAVAVPVYSALLYMNADKFIWNTNAYWSAIGENSKIASLLLLEQGNGCVNELIAGGTRELQARRAAVNSGAAQLQTWAPTASGGIVTEDF